VPDELFVLDGRLWPSPELSIAHDIAIAIDHQAQVDLDRENWRSLDGWRKPIELKCPTQ
jgi:hypothetical protein